MNRRTGLAILIVWLTLTGTSMAGAGSDAPERLERFRRLAATGLGALELSGHDPSEELLREIYGILDDEIAESLRSGGLFASQAFLQDRLDAFNEAWGGTAFRILALPGSDLMVGAFQLSPKGSGNSIRIYRQSGSGAGLVSAIHREGVPLLREMPTTRAGDPQFLAAWVGPQSSRENTGLRLELWRRRGESVTLAWSADALVDGGLLVSQFSWGAEELSFRYELRYPGWKPGCAGQTEQEDLYRYVAARETFVLTRRRVHNGWHREFHRGLARFLSALNTKDDRALAGVVGDEALRRRLPTRLEADLVCDEAEGSPPNTVSVAAVEPPGTRAEHPGEGVGPVGGRPWTLVFRRTRDGWRLAAAAPVEPFSAKMTR